MEDYAQQYFSQYYSTYTGWELVH